MGVLPPHELASIVDEFAFRLYSVLAELHPDSIIVFSPLSILMGATLAYMAANGETLRQLQFGLLGKRPVTKLDLDQSIYGIMKEVNQNSFMRMENKVYLQVNETIGPKYQLCLIDNFGSEIENIDFATPTRNINDWVEEKTNGAIKDFLKFDALHSTTRVILLNTLHFKGNWDFLPIRTEQNFCSVNKNGTNEQINLEQYYLEGHWRGGNILGTDTLLMPFRGANVSRLVNVPSSVKQLRSFDKILKSSSLNSIWKTLEQTTTGWLLSRTDQSVVELGLVEAFKKMGMRNLFGPNADFASMLTSSVPLRVSRFIHKTYLHVDDKGAEAVAVSALQLHSKCSKKHVAVHDKLCDKAYFFTFVYEGDNHVLLPLFMGRAETPQHEFVSIINEFAFRLYSLLAETHPNNILVFSPFSIMMAAALCYMAANGETLREFQYGLFNGRQLSKEDVDRNFQQLLDEVNKNNFIRIDNKMYMQLDESIGLNYQNYLMDYFNLTIAKVDFSDRIGSTGSINEWIEGRTNKLIKDFVTYDALYSTTRTVLLNTIHFKANWDFLPLRTEFNFCEANINGTTERIDLEQYYLEERWRGGNILGTNALLMPFQTAMYRLVLVPTNFNNLRSFERMLKRTTMANIWKSMQKEVTGWLLSHTHKSVNIGLEDTFRKLGMSNMFSRTANFTEILESAISLRVSHIIHKIHIHVDDIGAEAVAVTAIQFHTKCSRNYTQVQEVLCNKPFFYSYLYETASSNVIPLFMGRDI